MTKPILLPGMDIRIFRSAIEARKRDRIAAAALELAEEGHSEEEIAAAIEPYVAEQITKENANG